MGTDKLLHMLICFIITTAVTAVCKNWLVAGDALVVGIISAFIVGLGKECYDKFIAHNCFDSIDFCFDIIGIAMSAFTIVIFI